MTIGQALDQALGGRDITINGLCLCDVEGGLQGYPGAAEASASRSVENVIAAG